MSSKDAVSKKSNSSIEIQDNGETEQIEYLSSNFTGKNASLFVVVALLLLFVVAVLCSGIWRALKKSSKIKKRDDNKNCDFTDNKERKWHKYGLHIYLLHVGSELKERKNATN